MNFYLQNKFRPVFALFLSVFALGLILQKMAFKIAINANFIIIVNGILFLLALVNFKRLSQIDLNNPNKMFRSVIIGTMLKFIIFGGAALLYTSLNAVPIGNFNLLIAMSLYLWYNWFEIGWTKVKKDA